MLLEPFPVCGGGSYLRQILYVAQKKASNQSCLLTTETKNFDLQKTSSLKGLSERDLQVLGIDRYSNKSVRN
jgi:hypothetical protein